MSHSSPPVFRDSGGGKNPRWTLFSLGPLAVSLILHLLLLILLGGIVIIREVIPRGSFVNVMPSMEEEDVPPGPEGGGGSDGGAEMSEDMPTLSELMAPNEAASDPLADVLTSPTSQALTLLPPVTAITPGSSRAGLPTAVASGSGRRSPGFGRGSGLGKGIGDWIGSGSGGLGISGRGKTLKTINEFSVYFVIHSGDWFAALDAREAPASRQRETSPPGLADEKNIRWGRMKPEPNTGPFINYFWGGDWRKPGEDNRDNLFEFTPGAMGNLLRFVRDASAGNIKGSRKPSAVVLDRNMVPYRFNKANGQVEWLAEGRENFRERLRAGLPPATSFYNKFWGYLWNPQPQDPQHPDFTVEYLLDVKPMPPFIFFTGNDDFTLSDAEVETLYEYLLRGGAIWADSGFAGHNSKFDVAFRREIRRVIPDEDKDFRALKPEGDLFIAGPDAYFDATNGFNRLPHGLQYYDSPIEVIELMPGLVSVVLTQNGYGNFLRFEVSVVNNRFQTGGDLGRGRWAGLMWNHRQDFFRGLSEEAIVDVYRLGTNILVYMLGRWPAVLNRPPER